MFEKNTCSNKFGFSKKEFVFCLEKSGIKYIHIPELGIASEKRQELKTAKSSSSNGYDLFGGSVRNIETEQNGVFLSERSHLQNKLFEDYKTNLSSKQKLIDKLLQILEQDKLIAITCFEADCKCYHRHVLAESLNGIEVVNL